MASGALSSVGMRPARRSVMLPWASSVQKLQRTATSLRPELEADAGGLQRPAADQVLDRVVAEQAQVSRPAAGGDARPIGYMLPWTPVLAKASRLGVLAASSSVGPPGSIGRPPSPSATSITIFDLLGVFSSRTSC